MTPGLIRYIGGKSKNAGQIAALLPPHYCYVEPFAGGLAVLRAKHPAAIEIANDLDGELVHLFKMVAFRGEEVLEAIERLPVSRTLFAEWLKADPAYLSPIWRAARTYYLLSYSFGGRGEHFSTPSTTPRRGLSRATLEAFRARTARVIWESMDAMTLIERYDSPGTLFYVDPPYLGKDWHAQQFGGLARHRQLRDALKRCRGRWLLSHTDGPEIRELYAGFQIHPIRCRYAIASGKARPMHELLIANYPLNKMGAKSPPKPHRSRHAS